MPQQQQSPKQQVQLESVTNSLCDGHMKCTVSTQAVCTCGREMERERDQARMSDESQLGPPPKL